MALVGSGRLFGVTSGGPMAPPEANNETIEEDCIIEITKRYQIVCLWMYE